MAVRQSVCCIRRRSLSLTGLVGLLFLAACGQSVPPGGESVDSISMQAASAMRSAEEERYIGEGSGKGNRGGDLYAAAEGTDGETAEPTHEDAGEKTGADLDAVMGTGTATGIEAAGEIETARDLEVIKGTGPATGKDAVTGKEHSKEIDKGTGETAGGHPSEGEPREKSGESDLVTTERVPLGEPSSNESTPAPDTKSSEDNWDGDNKLTFGELYASIGVRGIELSEKVEALTGQEVEMSGYMAPPLTAGVRFFVLTKTLMAVCPFCSTDADWPADIVVVYLPDGEELNPTEHPVKVTGRLDTGSFIDEETGFVSLVRIYADQVEVLR